ncbi:hypothetical protein I540_3358 [Mycobacteroides abscessus subsp. bolletii 1513]|uniref:Uncharacterized protein n=1 Tax=Mycobacteroides abscessus subsp. bolletii 1513 TaxID=1299321 RepID=X8DQ84_9MYCO|nr:hypothetical protein I540_3358 [Mycobacteroides abscessus subsp. bolletii 1513]
MTYENFTSRSIVTVITGTCHGSSARRRHTHQKKGDSPRPLSA